jgi:PEP-CTERM motif
VALFLAAGPFYAAPARADVVFDFTGVCDSGCPGTATGVLTLADSYTFGADTTAADFVSFDYSSTHFSFDIASADVGFLPDGLNADGSFNSRGSFLVGRSLIYPLFRTMPGAFLVNIALDEEDIGATFKYTLVSGPVPEPSTWTMMLVGLAGLGYAGYRKARQTAVASA